MRKEGREKRKEESEGTRPKHALSLGTLILF
jgi:hypothetical protein